MALDYVRKSKVISSGLCKKIQRIDTLTYLNTLEGIVGDSELDNEYFDILLNNDYKDIEEARKVNLASFKRTQRLRQRIEEYLSLGECLFLTLTFTDKVLASTNSQSRKKYVSKCLKMMSNYYVANVDYGKENEREHYHALIVADKVSQDMWRYGNLDWQRVRHNNKSIKALPKYINKLTNHAIKETTKRCCMIYSKKVISE